MATYMVLLRRILLQNFMISKDLLVLTLFNQTYFQEGHTDKCLLEPTNIDKNIAIDLFIFNWTHDKNLPGSIEVLKCGKIYPIIEAPFAKAIKNSTEKDDCIKIDTLPLSVYHKPESKIVSVNGSVSLKMA